MVNFRANLISTVTVKNIQNSPRSVSFVEMKPASREDSRAMQNAMIAWGSDSYAWDIYNFFVESTEEQDDFSLEDDGKNRFFAITTQRSDLKNLISDRILALALVLEEKSSICLKFLQVDPDQNSFAMFQTYKGVGSTMVNALKDMFAKKDILLTSVPSAIEFYKKLGFNLVDDMRHMILKH